MRLPPVVMVPVEVIRPIFIHSLPRNTGDTVDVTLDADDLVLRQLRHLGLQKSAAGFAANFILKQLPTEELTQR